MIYPQEHNEAVTGVHGTHASLKAPPAARIAGIKGESSPRIQDLLGTLARAWQARGVRVTGLVEQHNEGLRKACGGSILRDIESGNQHRLYQELRPLSTACCLDASGVAEACQSILARIPDADVVILSKFGKLEAGNAGLIEAFIKAAEHNKPVLTSVAPAFGDSYLDFVGPWGTLIPADEEALEFWARETLKLSQSFPAS